MSHPIFHFAYRCERVNLNWFSVAKLLIKNTQFYKECTRGEFARQTQQCPVPKATLNCTIFLA